MVSHPIEFSSLDFKEEKLKAFHLVPRGIMEEPLGNLL